MNSSSSADTLHGIRNQANLRIIRAMQERPGVEDSKVTVNIDRYGDTRAAPFH
jgi:3-oxoacyl-[acyl-carrier-protein] synthase III